MTDQNGAYPRRALVLDDDDSNRTLLKVLMEMGKLDFAEAANGNDALALWRPGQFSFAFLDIEVPDLNGLEVARRIREQDSNVAIVMCSANDDPHIIDRVAEVDADMFMGKPYQLDVLLSLIRLLDRAGLRSNRRILVVDNMARARWVDRVNHVEPSPSEA